jgi:hypothetical protein
MGSNDDLFKTPGTHIGSGLFICDQIFARSITITSPFIKSSAPIEPAERVDPPEVDSFMNQLKKDRHIYRIQREVLTGYASKLIEVARIIKESAFDIVFCPMRGARMPGLQADLVCQTEPFSPFDGSDMAKEMNDNRILGDLRRLLSELPASEERKIGVLDTAIGGDSCYAMARLLRQLNEEAKQKWIVTFHLIYGDGRFPSRATGAYSFQTHAFKVAIQYHQVSSLLIEDEPGMLGYSVNRGAGQSYIVPYQQDGQIVIYGKDGATLFRNAPLDETMISLVGKEMMDLILTMPDIKPANLDYWPYGR